MGALVLSWRAPGSWQKRTLVLEKLTTTPIGEVLRDAATDVAKKAIERAIGPSQRLQSALTAGKAVPAFGQRRLRRYV